MQKHEHFEELCALAAVGDIPREEQDALMEHLATCGVCRQSYQDYCLLFHELPSVETDIERRIQPAATLESALKERFWARARAEKIELSTEAEKQFIPRHRTLNLFTGQRLVWAAVAVALVLVSFISVPKNGRTSWPGKGSDGDAITSRSGDPMAPKPVQPVVTKPAVIAVETNKDSIATIEHLNGELANRLAVVRKQLDDSLAEERRLERTISELTEANAQLESKGQQSTQLVADARVDLEKIRSERDQLQVSLVAEQAQAANLSEKMTAQTSGIERERQLLSADRDIRDLMGARSLHIIDVHDADSRGKDRKSFGRVFFTEGKSLIFYAFDLDENKLLNAKFSYRAWGERNGKPDSARNLGIFYADDRAQKRWVLKVDDPAELEGIDSVFVTLEPSGDRDKPSGHKLLYAFLNSEANHP